MRLSTLWALSRRAATVGRAMWTDPGPTEALRSEQARALYAGFRPAFEAVEAVDADALWRALASPRPPVLVDVRFAFERAVSTLPGAVAAADFLADPARHLGDRRPVIAFCMVGVRSGAWAAERRADGLTVANLEGGLLAWAHHGGVFVTPDGQPTRRLHVAASKWNLLPDGYEGVWGAGGG